MDEINKGLKGAFAASGNSDMESCDARVLAELMIQSNALITVKTAIQLSGLTIEDMHYRISQGKFPTPLNITSNHNEARLVFRIKDIQQWLADPNAFYKSQRQSGSDDHHLKRLI